MGEPTEEEIKRVDAAICAKIGLPAGHAKTAATAAITALRAMDREKATRPPVARTDELGVWQVGNDSPSGT